MRTRAPIKGAVLAMIVCAMMPRGFSGTPDKSGVKPSVISKPSGAGAIEGLGESFEPQLNTGGSSYGVAIAVPPGRAGLQPKLRLAYNSNLGNSMVGLGWSFDLPSIKRQTDKGFPAYDPSDVFLFEGEELVPLDNPRRDWRCENEAQFNRFRQIDTDGDLIPDAWEMTDRNGTRHLFGQHRGAAHRWSVVAKASLTGRSDLDRTYAWALDTTIDLHGNRVEYEYFPPNGDPASTGVLYPSRIRYAFHNGNFHEVRFRYQDRPDVFDDYRPTFSIRIGKRLAGIDVLSYYEGAYHPVRAYDLEFEYRPEDWITVPAGALDLGISTLKRFVQCDRTGHPGNFLPPILFEYSPMILDQAVLHALDPAPSIELAREDGTVQFADVNGDGLPDLFQTTQFDQRFCLNLGETGPAGSKQLQFSQPYSTNSAGSLQLQLPESGLADFNADGLVDFIHIAWESVTGGKRVQLFPNATRLDRFEPFPPGFATAPIELFNAPAAISLDDPSVRQMDVNFDKISDFVSLEPGLFVRFDYHFMNESGEWQSLSNLRDDMPGGLSFAVNGTQNPAIHLADMNGDRLLDLVYLEKTGVGAGAKLTVRYWPYCALGEWASVRVMVLSGTDTFQIDTLDLADVLVQDLTGDGMSDIALMRSNGGDASTLELRVNIAGYRWSPPFHKTGLPRHLPRNADNATTFRQADLNGNGSTDLMWRNQTQSQSSWQWLELLPSVKPNLLVRIDNSQGKRTEITYGNAVEDMIRARESGYPWRTKCPVPTQVVRRIRTTCGQDLDGMPDTPGRTTDHYVSEFQYRDPYYDAFEREFRGFAFAQRVDYGDDFLLDANLTTLTPSSGWDAGRTPTGQVSGPTLVTRFRYLTGASDGLDNDEYPAGWTGPRQTDERWDQGGAEEEILKGRQVWEEKADPWVLHDPAGSANFDRGAFQAVASTNTEDRARITPDEYVYSRARQAWRVRRLYRPDDPLVSPPGRFAASPVPVNVRPGLGGSGRSVSFAFVAGITNEILEANGLLRGALDHPARSPVRTAQTSDADDYGNTIVERNFGVVGEGLPDDERFVWTDIALDGEAIDRWILAKPARVRVTDEHGVFVSETRHFYDGPQIKGLSLYCIGSRALLHRTEQVVTGNTPPPDITAQSDVPGNPRLPSDHAIQQSRNAYDAFGNVIATLDPLGEPDNPGAGHARHMAFDPLFQTFPVEERIVLGGGKPDLVMRAGYDPGFGVLTNSIDFNGFQSSFEHDSFGRLVAIIKPYDSPELPTALFQYIPADPNRARVYRYDRAGRLAMEAADGARVSNRVVTQLRDDPGQPAVFTTVAFTDGCGRALAEIKEGDLPGRWIVTAAQSYNRRMQAQSDWLPYEIAFGSDDANPPHFGHLWPAGRPPVTSLDGTPTVRTDKRSDPTGREILVIHPPESWAGNPSPQNGGEGREESGQARSLTQFLPLETRLFDENDNNPGSPFAGTPMIQFTDGLSRLIRVHEVVRLNDDGTPVGALNEWPTRYRYDLNDKLVHIRDSQNNEKWFRYDGLGRKIFMNDPDRGVMQYTYDEASNLLETLDAKNQRISCTYDGANRLLTEDYHDQAVTQASSLQVATLLASRESEGIPPGARFSYNRSPDVTYHYDTPAGLIDLGDNTSSTPSNTRGCLAWVEDTSGEEHRSYDARGRVAYVVKRIPDPQLQSVLGQPAPPLISYKTGFDYDSMDRVTRVLYPDNDEVRYEYSPRNQVRRIPGGPNGSVIADIQYQPSDQIARVEYGNGVQTAYSYDPRLRLIELLTARAGAVGGSNELIHFDYSFDGAGNITRIEDQRPASIAPAGDPRRNTQIFSYDDLYRLTRVQYSFHVPGESARNDGEINYRYDRIGNMLSQSSTLVHEGNGRSVVDLGDMASGGSAGRFGRVGRNAEDSPGPHALHEIRNPKSEIRNYSYDGNGNMLDIDGLVCAWDFKDRLVAVENESMRAEYTYDYTDRRITKRVRQKAVSAADPPAGGGAGPSDPPPLLATLYIDKYFEVREQDAPVKYVWNGDTRVACVTGALSSNPRLQRIRLQPGWNLVSVALNGAALPSAVDADGLESSLAAFRWDSSAHSWSSVASHESLPAGAVLWLHAATHTTVVLSGRIIESTDRPIAVGPQFLPGGGVEPLPFPEADSQSYESISLWAFDGQTQSWQTRWAEAGKAIAGFPKTLPAGRAFFARADAPAMLPVTDPALRIRYYHQDHLGSTSVMTDLSRHLIQEEAYYPFGFKRDQNGASIDSQFAFTQKERDHESRLDYFEARYLASEISRFVMWDPILQSPEVIATSPQMLNAYSYVGNRPLFAIDPSGEIALPVLLFATVTALIAAEQVANAPVSANAPTESVPTDRIIINMAVSISISVFPPGAVATKIPGVNKATSAVASKAGSFVRSAGTFLANKAHGTFNALSKPVGSWLKSEGFSLTGTAAPAAKELTRSAVHSAISWPIKKSTREFARSITSSALPNEVTPTTSGESTSPEYHHLVPQPHPTPNQIKP